MQLLQNYEAVIGVEVHVELATRSKLFCSCPTSFGAEANTQCCPVCLGLPGALPSLNRKALEYAAISGLSTHCTVNRISRMDRKNYFYPDLPKAYQISQLELPVCQGGYLDIATGGKPKRIGITRIHIEEDAGKLIHDTRKGTLIDYNRSGIPLIEIVSEPDLRSAEETVEFVKKLRNTMIFSGVSECKMNKGELRCDVNISVRKKGDGRLGERTEIKNLNSFAFMRKAIESEYRRQIGVLEGGGRISRETRRFDENSGETFSMRSKEEAADYRFFPDPDIPTFSLTDLLKRYELGELSVPDPEKLKKEFTDNYGISPSDADIFTSRRPLADYLEGLVKATEYRELAVNLAVSELSYIFPEDTDTPSVPFPEIAELADMLGNGEINFPVAKRALRAYSDNGIGARKFIESEKLFLIKDTQSLYELALAAVRESPEAVRDHRAGKTAAFKAIIGVCMKLSGGRAHPELLAEQLRKLLNEN